MKDLAFLTSLLMATASPLLVGAETQPAPAASLTSATATAVSRTRLRPTAFGCADCIRPPRRKYFVAPELPTSSSSSAAAAAATGFSSGSDASESTDETIQNIDKRGAEVVREHQVPAGVGIGGPVDNPCHKKPPQNGGCGPSGPRGPKKPKVPKHPRLPAEPEPTTTSASSKADPTTVTVTVGPRYTTADPPPGCYIKAHQNGMCGDKKSYPLTVWLPMTTAPASPDSPGADAVTVTVTSTPVDTWSDYRRRFTAPAAPEHTPTYVLDPRPTGAALQANEVGGDEDLDKLVSGGLRRHKQPKATQKPKPAQLAKITATSEAVQTAQTTKQI